MADSPKTPPSEIPEPKATDDAEARPKNSGTAAGGAGTDSAPLDWTSTRKPKNPTDDNETPPERFLEFHKTPAGHTEIRLHPPPESDEDRRLRKREELLSREESLQAQRQFDEMFGREREQWFTKPAGFTPIVGEPGQPASHWGRVIVGIAIASIVLVFCFAAAYQQAGVISVLIAHLLISLGWIAFVLSIGFADYYLPLTRRQKIKLWIVVGCTSLLFAGAADWYMVHLKVKQIAEESKPTNPK
jgi:hypothetical protein